MSISLRTVGFSQWPRTSLIGKSPKQKRKEKKLKECTDSNAIAREACDWEELGQLKKYLQTEEYVPGNRKQSMLRAEKKERIRN